MQNKPMGTIRKPTYMLESVDNALRLLQLLRDAGAIRLKDAAAELGTAPSTAHRLLAMLVYRGFAVQDEKRMYHPGPALGVGPASQGWTRDFTDLCRPHMEALATLADETVNLVIRVGSQARFLWTAEAASILRVGDRRGQVLPAELTAGGRILLAELPRTVLEQLYLRPADEPHISQGPSPAYETDRRMAIGEFEEFAHELEAARKLGFAVNVEQTEEGVAAIGVAIRNGRGTAIGALTVAVPVTRYRQHLRGRLVAQMQAAVRGIEVDVADIAGPDVQNSTVQK
ncbi:transcriptional regulator, IclR family [Rhodococcus rhodochrous J3]|uniref:Transcriptional regulator, IclR family n=1 Tax=Rhodococcus rhodochrous J3 TaxID=903528 RepID=A0ABY1MHM2_RHORH|nr:IclR family transcriptional regulator [Rhodococcus rhodochrous]MBF4477297.1 IclR family transcriptional regulator [Rhodococcus rhodochrous]MCB8912548.1 IclR family transcriptional regulator [Rhodococcus rhodochrous]MCD2099137.1 IclR family transcriptional regulator [Rhodococcus rhodochrous]MCD2123621.1 IclR family transcriptional regulator [Rhodococcus rhodochrous]MCQ4137651.1 IclR family transcriptional regulator [Rhodococcus rhodochrous]